ncbi:DUF4253 domain-containing protein [Streptomyces tsukubensis]|uniref:DUF4253 domain-containing protein n=1 Tax=Streptomyces tsukubensis TaxID=83656 RepID=UPI00369C1D01
MGSPWLDPQTGSDPDKQPLDALLVTVEHFAFCPDNIWQSSRPHTLASCAEQLVDNHAWKFWWD